MRSASSLCRIVRAMILMAFALAFFSCNNGDGAINWSQNGEGYTPGQIGGGESSGSSGTGSDAKNDAASESAENFDYSKYDFSGLSYSEIDADEIFSSPDILSISSAGSEGSYAYSYSTGENTDSLAIPSEIGTYLFDDSLCIYQTEGQIMLVQAKEADGSKKNYSGALSISLSGNFEKGVFISVKKDASLRIILDGVTMSSGNYPCILNDGKCPVHLAVKADTANTLKDGRSYGIGYSEAEGTDYYSSGFNGDKSDAAELTREWKKGSDKKGTIFTKGDLFISGTGTLSVIEGYKHCIAANKGMLRILENVTLNLTSSGRDGIRTANGFVMDNGTVTIKATGEYTDNESRGIVVEGLDDPDDGVDNTGFVIIKNGKLDITSVSKGITAKWDIDEDCGTYDGVSDDSLIYPDPFVLITGGEISVKTTGTPYESKSSSTVIDANGVSETVTAKLSPEGIEGKAGLYIAGGKVICETTDDCINVSQSTAEANTTRGKGHRGSGRGEMVVSGGLVYAYSSSNDAFDSNGKLTISGGAVVGYTITNPECAFDCDNNTFAITGGVVVGIGTNNYSSPTASACKQGVIVLGASESNIGKYGTHLAIVDSTSSPVFVAYIPANSDVAIISSSGLTKSGTYKILKGVTPTGGTAFMGLYTEMPVISGGSMVTESITFSNSYVYAASSAGKNQGPQDGAPWGSPGGSGSNSGPGRGGQAFPDGSGGRP